MDTNLRRYQIFHTYQIGFMAKEQGDLLEGIIFWPNDPDKQKIIDVAHFNLAMIDLDLDDNFNMVFDYVLSQIEN
jgi:hypothetical protein